MKRNILTGCGRRVRAAEPMCRWGVWGLKRRGSDGAKGESCRAGDEGWRTWVGCPDALMLQMGWFESSLQLSYGILDGLIWILLETCRIVSSASNSPVKRYYLKSRCQRKLCLLTVVTCASDAGRLFSTWFACDCRENIFKAAYKLFSWIFSIALYIPLLHTLAQLNSVVFSIK